MTEYRILEQDKTVSLSQMLGMHGRLSNCPWLLGSCGKTGAQQRTGPARKLGPLLDPGTVKDAAGERRRDGSRLLSLARGLSSHFPIRYGPEVRAAPIRLIGPYQAFLVLVYGVLAKECSVCNFQNDNPPFHCGSLRKAPRTLLLRKQKLELPARCCCLIRPSPNCFNVAQRYAIGQEPLFAGSQARMGHLGSLMWGRLVVAVECRGAPVID